MIGEVTHIPPDDWTRIRDKLVEEGRRIHKNVWTCDGLMQSEVAIILMAYDIWDYESKEETLARYAKEKIA